MHTVQALRGDNALHRRNQRKRVQDLQQSQGVQFLYSQGETVRRPLSHMT